MDIRANGELLPISDCEWALVTNKGLTLGADGSSIKYDLPDFTFTKFNTKSLSCLTTFQGSVTEHQYCCKRIVDAIYEPNLWIKKLYVLPVPSEELKNNSLIEQYDEWK